MKIPGDTMKIPGKAAVWTRRARGVETVSAFCACKERWEK